MDGRARPAARRLHVPRGGWQQMGCPLTPALHEHHPQRCQYNPTSTRPSGASAACRLPPPWNKHGPNEQRRAAARLCWRAAVPGLAGCSVAKRPGRHRYVPALKKGRARGAGLTFGVRVCACACTHASTAGWDRCDGRRVAGGGSHAVVRRARSHHGNVLHVHRRPRGPTAREHSQQHVHALRPVD